MNKHGYKLKLKNIKSLLKICYSKRSELKSKLIPLNEKIYRLEKARNNCKEQIKSYGEGEKNVQKIFKKP